MSRWTVVGPLKPANIPEGATRSDRRSVEIERVLSGQ